MSHTSTSIYVDTTNGVGISIADIQAVLQTSRNDIGGIIANALINKWAKYKPIKVHGLDFPRQRNANFSWKSVQEITALGEVPWWIGSNGQCGLTFTTYPSLGSNTITTANTFLYELLQGNLTWGYERPTGGINQYPYRFFDLNQYHHDAMKPVEGVYDNLRLISNGGANPTYNLTVQLTENRGDAYSVQLSDLTISNSPVSGWYVGILLYKSSTQFSFAFSTNTIGGVGDLNVEFPVLDGSYAGNATIVPFLSSVRASQGNDPGAGIFLSCDVAPEEVTIKPAVTGVQLDIYAQFGRGNDYVKYEVNIINNLSTQIVVDNLRVKLYDESQYLYNDLLASSVTIPAGESKSYASSRDEWDMRNYYDPNKDYFVIVQSDYQAVNGQVQVDDARNSNIF